VNLHFLGSSLTFLMVYVWARRNPHVRMSFLGLFSFHAPYLPWVLLSFSVLLGNSATIDLIGIVVGHVYYFLEDVYPIIADIRGWRVRRWLAAPFLLKQLFGEGGGGGGGARMNVMVPVDAVDAAAQDEPRDAANAADDAAPLDPHNAEAADNEAVIDPAH
jgi:hypothetical protein